MSEATHMPLVSVIMPVRNEAGFIRRSLGAVLSQDYPADWMEVLVVDGMSDDATRDLVSRIASQHQFPIIRLLDNPKRIVPSALNIGLQYAKGDIIIIIGGHSEIAPDYVRECVQALGTSGADCVGGQWQTVGTSRVGQAIAVAQSSPFGIGNVAYRTRRPTPGFVDTVPFGAYRRDVFERIGGFDERLGGFDTRLVRHQDYEFNVRLRQAGGRIYYTPAIQARYYSRSSFRKLARQYLEYGFWKAFVTLENPRALAWRHLAPIGLVGALAGGAVLSIALPPLRPLYAGLWLLYGLACLLMALKEARRAGWRCLPLLPA
ncbi:MAG: glycosyltransferase family 2 protein, partial [Anaerolineae bacterium]